MKQAIYRYKSMLLILFGLISCWSLSAQQLEWARSWGSTSGSGWISADDEAFAITQDNQGNVYTTGVFAFAMDFDPGPGVFMMTPSGSGDAFVSKLDADGNFLWARRMGGTFSNARQPYRDAGKYIAADDSGNVYVSGVFAETADFGSFTLTSNGGVDVFICKLDPNGNFLWAKSLGGNSNKEEANSLVLDDAGHVYVSGHFAGTIDFDPGPGVYKLTPVWWQNWSVDSANMFVLQLDRGGNFIWAKNLPCWVRNVQIDKMGNAYIVGGGNGVVDFDPGPGIYNLNLTSSNFYKWTLSASGSFVAVQSLPYMNQTLGWDEAGNLYFTAAAIIGKYDSLGNLVWLRDLFLANPNSDILIMGGTLDNEGNTYLTGNFNGTVDFDPGPAVHRLFTNEYDVFVLKLDKEGQFVWVVNAVKGPLVDRGLDIIVDDCDHVYTTGFFSGTSDGSYGSTADFDPGPGVYTLTSVGHHDVFAHKMRQAPPPYITVDTFILGVSQPYVTYQWYRNSILIPDATDSIYIADNNGDYTVVVTTAKGCTDTTPVYKVTNFYDQEQVEDRISSLQPPLDAIEFYPNPAQDILYFKTNEKVNVLLTTIEGRIIKREQNVVSVPVKNLAAGMYLLRMTTPSGKLLKMGRFIKK